MQRTMTPYRALAMIALGGALLAAGCADAVDSSSGVDTPNETSLSVHVMPLISQSCGGCHTRTNAPFPPAVANEVYYDNEDDLLGMVGTFILAGDAANSGFVAILTQDFPVGQGPTLMPPPDMAEPMTDDAIAVVTSWINEGAQDN